MVSAVNPAFWKGKKVFLTGHTGFKGSWLSLWLQSMGAEVKGFALEPPTTPALFLEARVADGMQSETGDIRDLAAVSASMKAFSPDILIHMAAQPLVRLSYRKPVETYSTNVMGTVHVLEAARQCPDLKAIVNVTTDKCYENREWVWGYREHEPMGGHDPYSNSKGCSELVTAAYRSSFFNSPDSAAMASARAGNVIGGGDWAEDRLIPDILRAFEQKQPVVIRNPLATRPWQHVLEPLSGYLMLAEKLYSEGETYAEGWNFGPRDEDVQPVEWILDHMVTHWGDGASWQLDNNPQPHEAQLLKLDISKATSCLKWQPRWSLARTLGSIVEWHQCWLGQGDVHQMTLDQIARYQAH
ncbi:CDP-glucose 4,6-dehydratase [Marinobacter persicus]|uniref:CDP-glucose 4,6-dehydratase n=1 Tax=Marinobacter persicus TaxID=930118 RepID=A0A1I3PF13_9GAMM|nr:CDP-glucose 4,6-dehydratase [Marinobacter persicus]SFJ20082.1 CDP-glucose 4,6-dehydratase [Marinobacter persicus]